MKTILRNIVALVVLIGVGFLVTNYYGSLQEQAGVKGTSTDKAQEITEDISSDIGQQVDTATEKAGEVKVSEIVGFFQRFQKIPEDFANMKDYVTDQFSNVTNKEK